MSLGASGLPEERPSNRSRLSFLKLAQAAPCFRTVAKARPTTRVCAIDARARATNDDLAQRYSPPRGLSPCLALCLRKHVWSTTAQQPLVPAEVVASELRSAADMLIWRWERRHRGAAALRQANPAAKRHHRRSDAITPFAARIPPATPMKKCKVNTRAR